jgi:uncharacterized protein (DUF58 family)
MQATAAFAPAFHLRQRFQRWLQSRQPRTDTLQLTQRNVYILPTKAGLLFAGTVVVLLLASINYQLNLGYVLTFLLAGSGVVSMHITHATLRGLTLHLKPVAPVFVGEAVLLDVVLTSPGSARFGVGMKVGGGATGSISWINVPALGQTTTQLSFVAASRGRVQVPTLGAETRFPLGLFRTWTVWRPAADLLVYPKPELPPASLPITRAVPGGPAQSRGADSGEVEGVRAYRRGDPPKLIAWRKASKSIEAGGELISRDTSASVHQALWLDWQACASLPPEERLSRLTAWILAAHRAGIEFGLRIPGQEIALASGDAHRRHCLEVLALWQ